YEMELEKQRAEQDKIESGKQKNEWGSQIRSYVLDDRRVKDHRTGFETRNPEMVLDGGRDGFIKAYLMNHNYIFLLSLVALQANSDALVLGLYVSGYAFLIHISSLFRL